MMKMPVWKAKRSMPASEFVEWVHFLRRNRRHPLEYYLAQLTAEIVAFKQMFTDSRKSVWVKDFLLGGPDDGEDKKKLNKRSKVKPVRRTKEQQASVDKLRAYLLGGTKFLEGQ